MSFPLFAHSDAVCRAEPHLLGERREPDGRRERDYELRLLRLAGARHNDRSSARHRIELQHSGHVVRAVGVGILHVYAWSHTYSHRTTELR